MMQAAVADDGAKTFSGGSEFGLPSRYDSDAPMSAATINQVLTLTYKAAQKDGKSLAKFGPHDLRRTASTLLHEAGYNTDWVEKCLAHEDGRSSRSIYNKAEYAEQRRHMLQEWANMADAWIGGHTYVPKLMPENVVLPTLSATA